MKKIVMLFSIAFLAGAFPLQAWGGEAFSTTSGDLMAWVSGRHLTLTWDLAPEASGCTIQAGFTTGTYVASLDVGFETTFSASNVAEGTYYVQIVPYDESHDPYPVEERSQELVLVVRGDASEAGVGGEHTGVWNITMELSGNTCEGIELISADFPIQVDQRGQSLLIALGGFNFRGALRQDNSFLLAGAQTWRYGDCHHTLRYYMQGTFEGEDISAAGAFYDTWFCREGGIGQSQGGHGQGSSGQRVQPENPGGGRPDNPGGGRPDNPGGGRPEDTGQTSNTPQVNRCSLTFSISGTR